MDNVNIQNAYSTEQPDMNFIRDIKIRPMMIIILIAFSVLWGGVAAFALHSLNQLTTELSLTDRQQENGDIINDVNGNAYRVANTLGRLLEARHRNDTAAMAAELASAAASISAIRADMDTFKTTDHANINKATIDTIYNHSYQLLTYPWTPRGRYATAAGLFTPG